MTKLPWFGFYPGDWLRDQIAFCSLAAQGLWLRMMIVMHDSTRYGYLSNQDGTSMQPESIARRCGCSPAEYAALIRELDEHSVPSRTADGTIFSRRMVRDAEQREKNASRQRKFKNQKKDGNANGNGSVTPMVTAEKRAGNKLSDSDLLSISVQKTEFEAIWKDYPDKVGKEKAYTAFRKTVKTPVDLQAIQKALANYRLCVGIDRRSGFDRRWKTGEVWFRNWHDWLEWEEPRKHQPPDVKTGGGVVL